jgi:vacuolar-type H+-ATPase subunit I/STV1
MAKYTPPEQSKGMQVFDIAFLVVAIFAALWLPLKAGWAGASKSIDVVANPTWETLGQTPAMVEQWNKLGYADAASAHDVIQNHFHYNIDWLQLVLMAAVVIGYFIFLFKASDREYRDVIDEKFNGK